MRQHLILSAILVLLSVVEQVAMLGGLALQFWGCRPDPTDPLPAWEKPGEVAGWLGRRWLPIVLHGLIASLQQAVRITRDALPQPFARS